MSRNDIIHLTRNRLFGLFSLKTLNLSRNHLGSLDAFPDDLFELAVLDVSHNRLREEDIQRCCGNVYTPAMRGTYLAGWRGVAGAVTVYPIHRMTISIVD